MSKNKWIWLLVGIVILGGLGLYSYSLLPDPPQIIVEPVRFDWGEIPNDRPITQEFLIENRGGQPLEILGVTTSCGCTTARVEAETIKPGGQTRLWVTLDPTAHDPMTGPVVRFVYIRTNDPETPEFSLELHAALVEPKAEEGDRP
jgi:hypothetical protein